MTFVYTFDTKEPRWYHQRTYKQILKAERKSRKDWRHIIFECHHCFYPEDIPTCPMRNGKCDCVVKGEQP